MGNDIGYRPPPGTCDVNPSTGTAICTPPDRSVDALRDFVEGELGDHVDAYSEHTEPLNWRANNLGVAMTDAQREQAVDDLIAQLEADDPQWEETLEQRQSEVASDGRELLAWLGEPEIAALPRDERDALLQDLLSEDNPQARVAILTALGADGGASTATIDAAMGFFDGVDLVSAAPEFAGQLAQARLQRVNQVLQAVDPSDPATVRAAEAAIEDLRGSRYASMLDMPSAEFDAYLDALRETVTQPGANLSEDQVNARLDALDAAADDIDTATGDPTLSQGLRLLGLGTGAIGLATAGSDLFSDPNPETALRALTEILGVGNETTDLLVSAGRLADDGRVATTLGSAGLGKVLGAAGLVFGGIDLARYARDGDWAQASIAGIGLGGSALALFGTASWAGPVGIAIGVIAAAGSLGLNQWRSVDASNEFMNETSRDFLMEAGFSVDTADALVDQSGEGFSPVPFLFTYAASRGLDREQTVVWLNSLDADDLASIRDRAHEVLDSVNGDLSQLDGSADADTLAYLTDFQQAGGEGTWHQGNTFPLGDDVRRIEAGSWEEFSALLGAKGLPQPSPPLGDDGTPMDLATATETALAHFDTFSGNGDEITYDDLSRIRNDADADLQLRLAAEFLLDSRVSRYFLDVGQGEGDVDNNISRDDLEGALETIATGDYLDELADTARGRGGRDGEVSDEDYSAASVDPGLTEAQRHAVSDERTG